MSLHFLSLHFAEVMAMLRAEQHVENVLHDPVADHGSWQGCRDEGWLCRLALPCASAHSSQCGRGGELTRSYPIECAGLFASKEMALSGAQTWLLLLVLKCCLALTLTCFLWASQKLY